MKKTSQLILNLFVLILMVLNPLSSFASSTVQAQTISDAKTAATVDITANKVWQGGPKEKPELWFLLMRENADKELEPVPSILPKQITEPENTVTWYGLPKYYPNGTEIVYKVHEGIWDALKEKFHEGAPEGYTPTQSQDGLTLYNVFNKQEIITPIETTPPLFEPIKKTETPIVTPEPTEPTSTAEPTEPTSTAEPTEPAETAEPTKPTVTATPTEPAVTPEPTKPTEIPQPKQPSLIP